MSLLVCVYAVQKKLNFDLLTPSPGSVGGGGGGGGWREGGGVGDGEANKFSVMLQHPTLYWISLARR